MKSLVGVAPNSAFIFISVLFTGSISDCELFIKSGIESLLRKVPARKSLMVDRGFEIQDLILKYDLLLNIPPLRGNYPVCQKRMWGKHRKLLVCAFTWKERLVKWKRDSIFLIKPYLCHSLAVQTRCGQLLACWLTSCHLLLVSQRIWKNDGFCNASAMYQCYCSFTLEQWLAWSWS